MLLQLPSFPQIPGAHGVVQAASPQLGPVVGDVYAAGPVGVALELSAEKPEALGGRQARFEPWKPSRRGCVPNQSLVVKVPDGNVPVGAA